MSILKSITKGAVVGAVSNRSAGRGILGAGLGLVATRIATRSVPGALLVGGGLLAKMLWDKKREKDRKAEVEAAFDEAATMKRAKRVKPKAPREAIVDAAKSGEIEVPPIAAEPVAAEPVQLPPIPKKA